jgi:mRNA interferase MazF
MSYVPRRGDVVWLSFDPRAGHEQVGRRPAFVLSPETYNRKTGLFLACPITSRVKGYPFEVGLPEGLAVGGVILADQIKSLDWKVRKAEFTASTSDKVFEDVLALILPLIGKKADSETQPNARANSGLRWIGPCSLRRLWRFPRCGEGEFPVRVGACPITNLPFS